MSMMDFKGPGFRMQVPTDWMILSSPQFQVMFLAPDLGDPTRPNLAVTIRPLGAETPLANVVEMVTETQKKEFPEFEILDQGPIEGAEEVAYLRTYKWHNPENQAWVLQQQMICVIASMLYTLTATRDLESPSAKLLDASFDHMLKSFHFE